MSEVPLYFLAGLWSRDAFLKGRHHRLCQGVLSCLNRTTQPTCIPQVTTSPVHSRIQDQGACNLLGVKYV